MRIKRNWVGRSSWEGQVRKRMNKGWKATSRVESVDLRGHGASRIPSTLS
jgi:hypothetical protein